MKEEGKRLRKGKVRGKKWWWWGVIRRRKEQKQDRKELYTEGKWESREGWNGGKTKEGGNRKGKKGGLNATIYKALLELFLDFHTQYGGPHL